MRNKLILAIAATLVSTAVYAYDITFDTMDSNSDGKVTKDEFHGNVVDAGIYSDFDTNGDGYLSTLEYSETNFDEGLYSDWDANNDDQLNEYEYYNGSFSFFDENEDGYWESNEWDDAGDEGFWDI